MENIVIGVGGLAASKKPGNVIKTYGLGSCVAMILIDLKMPSMLAAMPGLSPGAINRDKWNGWAG